MEEAKKQSFIEADRKIDGRSKAAPWGEDQQNGIVNMKKLEKVQENDEPVVCAELKVGGSSRRAALNLNSSEPHRRAATPEPLRRTSWL